MACVVPLANSQSISKESFDFEVATATMQLLKYACYHVFKQINEWINKHIFKLYCNFYDILECVRFLDQPVWQSWTIEKSNLFPNERKLIQSVYVY